MKKMNLIALLCFLSLASCKENNTEAQSAALKAIVNEKIDATDYKSKTEDKRVQLIDVRTPEEYNTGHIKNARNIDFFDPTFDTQMNTLDKDAPLYIYCRSGRRSASAANKLIAQGFTEIYDLKGGILAWQQQNLELVK